MKTKPIPMTVFTNSIAQAELLASQDPDSRALTSGVGSLGFHRLVAEHGAGVFTTLYAPLEFRHQWKAPVGGIIQVV